MTIDFEKMAKGFTKTAKERGMCVGWWIPVSEWLPEKNGRYLVTIPLGDSLVVKIGYFVDNERGFNSGNVIAWLPLPEPYKAESEDKE